MEPRRFAFVTDDGEIVWVSEDGERWSFPAGRPEGTESWEQTLRREMLEEACASVVGAKLLGFVRGECVEGPEQGRILVRSMWRADVELGPWEPQFEIRHRRVVNATGAAMNRMSRSIRSPRSFDGWLTRQPSRRATRVGRVKAIAAALETCRSEPPQRTTTRLPAKRLPADSRPADRVART
jgi:ADP-ribose pyrophosphatase YjhB (NUDIX family)